MGYIDTNKPLFDLIEAERQAEAGIAAAQLRRPNLAAATNIGRAPVDTPSPNTIPNGAISLVWNVIPNSASAVKTYVLNNFSRFE